jgi:5-methylcytosine-specific restriction enzyme subunit McrC
VRLISLREFETSSPLPLTVDQRDALRRLLPDLRLDVVSGESNMYELTPGSRIGAVALDDLAVEIAPKLSIQRVLYLVSYSLGLAKWGDRPFEMTTPDSIVEAMIPIFAHHLERALRRGVLQGYRTQEDALTAVRGRIRFDEQVRRRFGILLPVEVRFDDFTEDILENRLLKAALATLGKLRLRSDSSRQSLRRFTHVLELVSLQAFDPQNVPHVAYTRLNEHYRGAIEWARLVLRFAATETRHGKVLGTTVLFDMNDVFEEFVRVALREELGLSAGEFPSGDDCPSLFLDRVRRVALEPDLTWWSAKRCRFVGDVKYKAVNVKGVKHPDLYQLLAYTTASGLQSGLLVYAAGEGKPATHEVTLAGKLLHVRALELSGDIAALRNELREVAALIRKLATVSDAAA